MEMEIELASDEQGDIVHEKVPVEKIGKNLYKLTASPGIIGNLAYRDEVELDPKEPLGYRLLYRAGFVCVHATLSRKVSDADLTKINAILNRIQGWVDGSMSSGGSHLLVFTIPSWSTFPAIEKTLEEIKRKFPIRQWMYGNVYDPADGETPLDWWEDQEFE